MILVGLKCRAGFLLRILWCCQSGGSFRKYFSEIWLHTRFHGSRNQKKHSILLATYWNLYIKIGRLGQKKQHFIFQNAPHIFFLSFFLSSFRPSPSLSVEHSGNKIVFGSLRFPVFLDFLINVEPAFSWRYEALLCLVFFPSFI